MIFPLQEKLTILGFLILWFIAAFVGDINGVPRYDNGVVTMIGSAFFVNLYYLIGYYFAEEKVSTYFWESQMYVDIFLAFIDKYQIQGN